MGNIFLQSALTVIKPTVSKHALKGDDDDDDDDDHMTTALEQVYRSVVVA